MCGAAPTPAGRPSPTDTRTLPKRPGAPHSLNTRQSLDRGEFVNWRGQPRKGDTPRRSPADSEACKHCPDAAEAARKGQAGGPGAAGAAPGPTGVEELRRGQGRAPLRTGPECEGSCPHTQVQCVTARRAAARSGCLCGAVLRPHGGLHSKGDCVPPRAPPFLGAAGTPGPSSHTRLRAGWLSPSKLGFAGTAHFGLSNARRDFVATSRRGRKRRRGPPTRVSRAATRCERSSPCVDRPMKLPILVWD